MQKSRLKSDIRRLMAAERAELARRIDEARAFKPPRVQSWHDLVLRELLGGATIEVAAQNAGVTRAGIRYARQHNRRFSEAYNHAYGISMRKRTKRAHVRLATNGSTTLRNGLTCLERSKPL